MQIVEKLLIAAVADADVTVRRSIFSSLHESGDFDDFLAQADCLTAVFAALNDEVFSQYFEKVDNLLVPSNFYEISILVAVDVSAPSGRHVACTQLESYQA